MDCLNGGIIVIDIIDFEVFVKIVNILKIEYGGVDVVVYNVGVIWDKMLGGMLFYMWEMVININLFVEECINDVLLELEIINFGGWIVCVFFMSGIVGNFG